MSSNRAEIKVRVTPGQRAEIKAAARKLGLTVNDYVTLRALAAARDLDIEARIHAAIDARLAANSERLAADVQAARSEIVEQLTALDGRLKGAFTQLHKTIVGAQ